MDITYGYFLQCTSGEKAYRDEEDGDGEPSDILDDPAHVSRRDVGAVVAVDGHLVVGMIVEVSGAVVHERADARTQRAHAAAAERHALRQKLTVVDVPRTHVVGGLALW